MGIDDTDRRILRQLQRDCDISLDDPSERIGLSRNALWRRIKLMEESGLIARRVALVDRSKLGLSLTVFIQVRAREHSADWAARFAKAARALPQIMGVYRMSGDLDYLIRATVTDMADYDRLYQKLISSVEMADVSASFVMEEIKDTNELPL